MQSLTFGRMLFWLQNRLEKVEMSMEHEQQADSKQKISDVRSSVNSLLDDWDESLEENCREQLQDAEYSGLLVLLENEPLEMTEERRKRMNKRKAI